ncbi:MAG TPA: cyclic pyranopterin monophosphate synthase MoaC [Planctomycetota bacterium]|nr:cyclic pyranopterin monophosphate synthase MoaC [Planctomycetota bacterium]
MAKLTHLDRSGAARMVDVGEKAVTHRTARASVEVRMKPATLALIKSGAIKKGDALSVARIAGIAAAKRTAELIPLCHPIATTKIEVEFEFLGKGKLGIETRVEALDRTGVEMEALAAAAVAALTVYDMCKAVDRGMEIDRLRLLEKSGGRSGHYLAAPKEKAGKRNR